MSGNNQESGLQIEGVMEVGTTDRAVFGKRKALLIALLCLAILVAVIIVFSAWRDGIGDVESLESVSGAPVAIKTPTAIVDAGPKAGVAIDESVDSADASVDTPNSQAATSEGGVAAAATGGGVSSPTGNSSAGTPSSPAPAKTWIVDYQDVWVEPVYEQVWVPVQFTTWWCSCGRTFDNFNALRAHDPAGLGECGGGSWGTETHHSGYYENQLKADGYWKTIELGGHWE